MPDKMVSINDNIIHPKELRNLARIVLETLNQQKISSLEDLKHSFGQKFSIKEFPDDSIEILERPSNYGTKAFVLAYNRKGTGVIINTVSNELVKYSNVIIKGQFGVTGYAHFAFDGFGNSIMDKRFLSEKFSVIRKELQRLIHPENYFKPYLL